MWYFLCFAFTLKIHLCLISLLSVDELISPKDIDPIHRYVPRQDQRNVSMRYSNQVNLALFQRLLQIINRNAQLLDKSLVFSNF